MISWLAITVASSATAFIATNLDDLLLLLLFFAQANDSTLHKQQVVIGQYLGFTALIGLSLPGFLGGQLIAPELIGLLGFIPICIGIKQWLSDEDDPSEIQAVNSVGPAAESDASYPTSNEKSLGGLRRWLGPQTYSVAAVTIANGGDNVGIYVPLFANSSLKQLVVILLVFFTLVGVWCYCANQLTRQPAIARLLTRYGERCVPFVLIGLGLYILVDSGTLTLLPWF